MVARTSINEIKQLYQEYQLSTTNHNEIITRVTDLIFDTITNRSPAQIVDMGCGTNWVKKLPCMQPHTVIGVDWPIGIAHDEPLFNSEYDKQGKLEEGDDWCIRHQEKFDVAIALRSIHYCLMSELPSRINLLMQLVKLGGVAYITVNVQRMIDKAIELELLYRHKQFIKNELGNPELNDLVSNYTHWLRSQPLIYTSEFKLILPFNHSSVNYPKGNIHMLVQK